jgi:hypothetical protein
MGVYNPEIDKWVEVVHDAGGSASTTTRTSTA